MTKHDEPKDNLLDELDAWVRRLVDPPRSKLEDAIRRLVPEPCALAEAVRRLGPTQPSALERALHDPHGLCRMRAILERTR